MVYVKICLDTTGNMLIQTVLLASLSWALSMEIEVSTECASCVRMNQTCYNISYLLDLQAPFRNRVVIHEMGILRPDNMLYYSFEPDIANDEYYKVGFVKLDNSTNNGILGGGPKLILNFGTFHIDSDNELVYFGGSDGIYVLDTNLNKLSAYSSRGDTITDLFYKNNLYFIKYDSLGIVVKRGDSFKTLLEYIPIKMFVVNKNDVIVFSNRFGLFVSKSDITHRVSSNAFFRGLTVDLDGIVYAWWIDGIYQVVINNNLYDSVVVKVAHMPGIGAMTFDNGNNIIFTSDRQVFRMTEANQSVC